MKGQESIIADIIIAETVKELRAGINDMRVQHTAALILTETYLTVSTAAKKLSIDVDTTEKLAKISNNAFTDSKDYRRKIYKIITMVHERSSFKPKKQKLFTRGDLPGLRSSL